MLMLHGSAYLYDTGRIMKHFTAMHIVGEINEDTYVATDLSNALTEPKYCDGIIYRYARPHAISTIVLSNSHGVIRDPLISV